MAVLRSILLGVALTLAGCDKPVQRVDGAWVRLAAVPGAPAAGYFKLHGGATEDRLIGVNSPVAIRVEMHETMANGGMMSMKPIEGGVVLPPKGDIEFKQGGRHLMLFSVNAGIVPPKRLPLVFTFASGERIQVEALVQRVGDAPAQ